MRSLQDLSAFKVSAILWDIIYNEKKKIRVRPDATKIREYLLKLPITESAKDKVLDFLEPIGGEIMMWRWDHIEWNKILSKEYSSNDFVWAVDGTLDTVRTAEGIIDRKYEDTPTCYQLACVCCLENEIPKLWKQLKRKEKSRMMKSKLELVSIWSHFQKGRKSMDNLISKHHYKRIPTFNALAFREAVYMNNMIAIKYFLEKLNPEEKKEHISEAIRDSTPMRDYYDIYYGEYWHAFCLLYPHLTEEEKGELDPFAVLKSFLVWPYVEKFMDFARLMCPRLYEDDFNVLLKIIVSGYYTCNHLFEEFWNISPVKLKQGIYFRELKNGEENLRLIFKNKKRGRRWIIFQVTSFTEPLSKDYLDLFKFVLSCCCSTKDDLLEMKEVSLKTFRSKCGENRLADEVILDGYFSEQVSLFSLQSGSQETGLQ